MIAGEGEGFFPRASIDVELFLTVNYKNIGSEAFLTSNVWYWHFYTFLFLGLWQLYKINQSHNVNGFDIGAGEHGDVRLKQKV